jgi:hypothetical protein
VILGAVASFSSLLAWAGGAAAAPTFMGLGDLAGLTFDSRAWGVSADGSTVVGVSAATMVYDAFIWDATHGMRRLDQVLSDAGLGPALAG